MRSPVLSVVEGVHQTDFRRFVNNHSWICMTPKAIFFRSAQSLKGFLSSMKQTVFASFTSAVFLGVDMYSHCLLVSYIDAVNSYVAPSMSAHFGIASSHVARFESATPRPRV